MRRKRFQNGSLQKRKRGCRAVWVACWWEEGSRPSNVLGPCSQHSRGAAEAMLADIVRPLNEGLIRATRPACTFNEFVAMVYLPAGRTRSERGLTE